MLYEKEKKKVNISIHYLAQVFAGTEYKARQWVIKNLALIYTWKTYRICFPIALTEASSKSGCEYSIVLSKMPITLLTFTDLPKIPVWKMETAQSLE